MYDSASPLHKCSHQFQLTDQSDTCVGSVSIIHMTPWHALDPFNQDLEHMSMFYSIRDSMLVHNIPGHLQLHIKSWLPAVQRTAAFGTTCTEANSKAGEGKVR